MHTLEFGLQELVGDLDDVFCPLLGPDETYNLDAKPIQGGSGHLEVDVTRGDGSPLLKERIVAGTDQVVALVNAVFEHSDRGWSDPVSFLDLELHDVTVAELTKLVAGLKRVAIKP